MANRSVLGLFHEATSTADTIDRLRELGVQEDAITVMSGVPYTPEMLGRRPVYERLAPIALIGAVGGFLAALFLTVVTPHLYEIPVGGQPLVSVPPSIIIIFEFTMLGTLLATFGGLLAEIAFPSVGRQDYDPRITEGHIGVLAVVDEALVEQVQSALEETGAHHLKVAEADAPPGRRTWQRLALVGGFAVVPTVIGLLFAYSVLVIPLPNQMVNQPSVAYEQGPRLAAPLAAVPVQGPILIAGQPASESVPASADSVQRGGVLFDVNCAMCHGQDGGGRGRLSGYFTPPPADLTSERVQALSDQQIFLVLTNGWGLMPSMAENLTPVERWDVINHVRSLKK
ncbi:MAG TPA: quinol:electron acceptor oxidoreductase subunit ActD [Anaerolineae bacterium]|nr:quinol:electron acceptor oxidoreductase subunit ActD [Anaerolineae bacterium]